MQFEHTLAGIVQKLKEGRFPNEPSISQGIVLPILSDLGWNVFDTTTVWPEYSTGEGRVDFALCAPSKKPKCFLEVKRLGKAEGGVRQALEYAFHEGAQFVTLTDGKTWSFYLPAEHGSYEDRRVFMLDLFERSASESAEVLYRYLDQERVASGEALETARKEYRNKNRRLAAREAIPESWHELVERKDKQLVELLTDAVESKSGIRPDEKDILNFLSRKLTADVLVPVHLPKPRGGTSSRETKVPRNIKSTDKRSFVLLGERFSYGPAIDAMVLILSELAKSDPTFLQRCSEHPAFRGHKRKYVARSAVELYPDRPDMAEKYRNLPGGWVAGTYLSNQLKIKIIRGAAEVAGITFGRDVIIDF